MNAKVFLFACLFIGVATLSVNAQDKANNADQGWYPSTYWSPVYCDGDEVDVLSGGEIMIHYVYRTFKNGELLQKEVAQIKGTVTSDKTGEVFKIRETDKYFYIDHWVMEWHYNLIGNQGSHYIGTLFYDYRTGEITVGHTTCN